MHNNSISKRSKKLKPENNTTPVLKDDKDSILFMIEGKPKKFDRLELENEDDVFCFHFLQ